MLRLKFITYRKNDLDFFRFSTGENDYIVFAVDDFGICQIVDGSKIKEFCVFGFKLVNITQEKLIFLGSDGVGVVWYEFHNNRDTSYLVELVRLRSKKNECLTF